MGTLRRSIDYDRQKTEKFGALLADMGIKRRSAAASDTAGNQGMRRLYFIYAVRGQFMKISSHSLYEHFASLLTVILAIVTTIASADVRGAADHTIKIGSASVESGSVVEIPISLENLRNFTALQFDIVFESSLFAEVDASKCTSRLPDGPYIAACERQNPPNDDVVRYVIFRTDSRPIESGMLGNLVFRVAADAPSAVSSVDALECTGLGISEDGETISLTTHDYKPGEIVVISDEPYAAPTAATAVVELRGSSLANDNQVFRRQLAIPDPTVVLRNGPDDIVLELPGGREIESARKRFVPRTGYVERLDCSGDQVPDTNPEKPLSFRWYGELPNHGWLGLTVVNDVARGTLVTAEASYQLSGSPEDGYVLSEIDPKGLPPAGAEAHLYTENSTGKNLEEPVSGELHVETTSPIRAPGGS